MTEHTIECKQETIARKTISNKWEIEWPHYCNSCFGYGYSSFVGHHDNESIDEPCWTCIQNSKCPRCFKKVDIHTYQNQNSVDCPHCGWNTNPEEWKTEFAHPDPSLADWPCPCEIAEMEADDIQYDDAYEKWHDSKNYNYITEDLAFDVARERGI